MSTYPAAGRMHEPHEPHGTSTPMPHHAINYYMIFLLLIGLTAVTVLIAYHRFTSELTNVLLALLIASVKATFVARYFMHLKFEGKLIQTIFLIPLALTVLLVVALIPDILRGRGTAFNDTIGTFEHAFLGEPSK